MRRERVPECLDAGAVPSLADVGNRFEHDVAHPHGLAIIFRRPYSSRPAAASASARLVNTRPDTTWSAFTVQIHCVGESEM